MQCLGRCLVEIYTAIKEAVPIVTVTVCGAFPYDFADVEKLLSDLPTELERRNPGASEVVRQAGINVVEMGELLRETLPYIISRRRANLHHTRSARRKLTPFLTAIAQLLLCGAQLGAGSKPGSACNTARGYRTDNGDR